MSLPNVFAIYRPATETFLLLKAERDDTGAIMRLKQWAPPNIKDIPAMPEEIREQFASWLNGNEWYVESMDFANECFDYPVKFENVKLKFNDIRIHDQIYKWCHTGYKLVWSNYHVHSRRNSLGSQVWNASPCIPILDFSSRQIYPRTYSVFYPRWVSVKSSELAKVLQESRELIIKMEDEIDYKDLRIRTPPPDKDDHKMLEEDYSPDSSKGIKRMSDMEDEMSEKAGVQILPILVLAILVGSVFGLYGLIGHMTLAI